MAAQYSQENLYNMAKFEFQSEELKKQMSSTKANFASIRFKKSMKRLLNSNSTDN